MFYIYIKINIKNKKTRKVYFYDKKKLNFFADLRSNKVISNKKIIIDNSNSNSLLNLYNSIIFKKKNYFQSIIFYKKILKERISVMEQLQK